MNLHYVIWEQGWQTTGWTMVYFLAGGSLIALLAAPLRILLRRADPTIRYASSLTIFTVLALMPIGIALWLSRTPAGEHSVATLAPIQTPQVIDLAITPLQSDPSATQLPTLNTPPSGDLAANSTAWTLEHAVEYFPWVWLAGTPLTFFLLATGLIGAERLRRTSQIVTEGPVHAAAEQLRAALNVGRNVTVAICDRLTTPLLVGVVRPLILLPPAALTGWSPDQLEMVLLHELAHVRRWDNLVNLLQRIVESLLFFHPAIWIVSNWVRRDREDCCDAVVVARTEKPQAYAELLVALASPNQPLAGLALARHPLAGRVRRILHLEEDTMLVSRNTLIAISTALLAVVIAISSYNPPETEADAEPNDDAIHFATEDTENSALLSEEKETSEETTEEGDEGTEQESITVLAPVGIQKINRIVDSLKANGYSAKGSGFGMHPGDIRWHLTISGPEGSDLKLDWKLVDRGLIQAVLMDKNKIIFQSPAVPIASTDDTPSPFPTLEEQLAKDLAYKLLGVDLVELTEEELARVKKLKFDGGLRVVASTKRIDGVPFNPGPLRNGDLLVGLQAWPTRSLEEANKILSRDDLDRLSPLNFYVIRKQSATLPSGEVDIRKYGNDGRGFISLVDKLVTGRIQVNLEAWHTLNRQETQGNSGRDVGHGEVLNKLALLDGSRESLERRRKQVQQKLSENMGEFHALFRNLKADGSANIDAKLSLLANEVRLIQQQIITKKQDLLDIEVMKTLAIQKANSPTSLNSAIQEELARDPMLQSFQQERFAVTEQLAQLKATTKRKDSPEVKRLQEHLKILDQQIQEYRTSKETELRDHLKSTPNDALAQVMSEYILRRKSAESDLVKLQEQFEENMEELQRFGQTSAPLDILESEIAQLQEVEKTMGLKLRSWDMGQHLLDQERELKHQKTVGLDVGAKGEHQKLPPRESDLDHEIGQLELEIQRLEYEFTHPGNKHKQKLTDIALKKAYKRIEQLLQKREERSQQQAVLTYDGKTFDEWRILWKTELNTEYRIECIKALVAFGRAGMGKEATKAILDVIEQYNFYAMDSVDEDSFRTAVWEALASSESRRLPESFWLPALFERYEKDPDRYQELLVWLLSNLRGADGEVRQELLGLTNSEDPQVRAAAYRSIALSSEDRSDPEVRKVLSKAMAESNPEIVKRVLSVLTYPYTLEDARPGGKTVLYLPGIASHLIDDDESLRRKSRKLISYFSPKQATSLTDKLIGIIQNKSLAKKHLYAIRALAILGENAKGAESTLNELIAESDAATIVAAAVALDQVHISNQLLGKRKLYEKILSAEANSDLETLRDDPGGVKELYQREVQFVFSKTQR